MRLVVRWLLTTVSLGAAIWLVPGLHLDGTRGLFALGAMALILTLVNALIQVVLDFLSCGCFTLAMGLLMIVINAAAVWLFAQLGMELGIGLYVDSYWAAFLGGLMVSAVSFLLSALVPARRA